MEELVKMEDAFSGKRVLVTGHSGFKGAWLTQWLLKMGAEVCGYSSAVPTLPSLYYFLGLKNKVRDVKADVRDGRRLQKEIAEWKPEFVFHLAAQSLVRPSYAQPLETFDTNVMGTLQVLEALRLSTSPCTAVIVTSDKCYENLDQSKAYSEQDRLGGLDPYSCSKAMCELAVCTYRKAYFGDGRVRLASARAGNVIGGGDWAEDRIFPDCVRALQSGREIPVRNPLASRPWQHVLDPLSGYLLLAARLASAGNDAELQELSGAFNFGPKADEQYTVQQLVEAVLARWPLKSGSGKWVDQSEPNAPHESKCIALDTSKAEQLLGWKCRWSFEKAVDEAVYWYREVHGEPNALQITLKQIEAYEGSH